MEVKLRWYDWVLMGLAIAALIYMIYFFHWKSH